MGEKKVNEKKLIEQAVKGSKEAFCELYGQYKDRLYRYAYYRLGNPSSAEDAVSDCVVSAWQGISALRKPKAFPVWLFRILNASCAKQLREMINERDHLEQLYNANPRVTPDPSLSVELSEALDQLEPEEREIVLLSVVAGMKSREIASVYGMTAGSVRSKLSRSLLKMRRYLEIQQ